MLDNGIDLSRTESDRPSLVTDDTQIINSLWRRAGDHLHVWSTYLQLSQECNCILRILFFSPSSLSVSREWIIDDEKEVFSVQRWHRPVFLVLTPFSVATHTHRWVKGNQNELIRLKSVPSSTAEINGICQNPISVSVFKWTSNLCQTQHIVQTAEH